MSNVSVGIIYALLAIIIIVIVYFVYQLQKFLREYFDKQLQMQQLQLRKDIGQADKNRRLQAYERLSLLFERLSIGPLVTRIQEPGLSNKAFSSALLIAIQKEFEHNVTQQLYVSDELWFKLLAYKQELMNIISVESKTVDPNGPCSEFSQKLLNHFYSLEINPTDKALHALRQEARSLFV